MDCQYCNKPLKATKRAHARFCDSVCKQASYRLRTRERAAAALLWQPDDKAIAHDRFIVSIGAVRGDYALVQVQYTMARVPDDKAAVWRKLPMSLLKPLKAINPVGH